MGAITHSTIHTYTHPFLLNRGEPGIDWNINNSSRANVTKVYYSATNLNRYFVSKYFTAYMLVHRCRESFIARDQTCFQSS